VVKQCDFTEAITRFEFLFELLIFHDLEFTKLDDEEAGPYLILFVDEIRAIEALTAG
jgi:hypothetical protein